MELFNDELVKDIDGYDGKYKITSYGRVYSVGKIKSRYSKGMFLKQYFGNTGYLFVGLYKNRKMKRLKVSRIVATHFIENKEIKSDVNHINGDKSNNRVENLEWCTSSENMLHAYKNGLKKPSEKQKKIASEWCRELGKISGKAHGKENGKKCKRLTIEQDEEIRNMRKNGATIQFLQNKFGVSNTPIIRAIRNNYVV